MLCDATFCRSTLLTPLVNLKEKISLHVLHYTKVSKENNLNIPDWRFFPFAAGVNDTGGAPWAANIFKNLKKKLETALMVYLGAWGNLIHEKNL